MRRVRVAVMAHPNPFATSELLRGVASYRPRDAEWEYRTFDALDAHVDSHLRASRVDAIVARINETDLAHRVVALGKPIVNAFGDVPHDLLPAVRVDDVEIGRAGARHLLAAGFKRFAFLHVPHPFSDQREEGFAQVLARPYERLTFTWQQLYHSPAATIDARIDQWLTTLTKPVAIMASSDERGRALIQRAQHLGLRVPEDVAVLGVDNNELRCLYMGLPMSSIDPDAPAVGYACAALLDRLLAGEPPPPAPIVVPVRRVVERRSTALLAVEDQDLTAALRLIRDRALRPASPGQPPVTVDEIAAELAISRSTLQRRFRDLLGRSPSDEIRRVRLDRARDLLLDTDLDMLDIAHACGYEHQSHFSTAFRQAHGATPRDFRRRIKRENKTL